MKKEIGMYIHIPFCKQKCSYCDFCSYAGKEDKKKEYFQALNEEIKEAGEANKQDYEQKKDSLLFVKTIYIGGGTPSYVESQYIKEILKTVYENFEVDENAEITIEVNPRNCDRRKVKRLQKSRSKSIKYRTTIYQ